MEIFLSSHAVCRAQQRGVRISSLYMTATYGKARRTKEGSLERTLKRRDIADMVNKKILSPSESDLLIGLKVITKPVSNGELVVTVLPRNN